MNTALKAMAALVGVYIVFQALTKKSEASRTDVIAPPAPMHAPAIAPAPAPPASTPTPAATLYTADQWNFVLGHTEAPEDFGFIGTDRFTAVTQEEYARRRAAVGLAGLTYRWGF